MKKLLSNSTEDTKKIANEWVAEILAEATGDDPLAKSGATVVALNGHLGSGKTTFTQFVAQALGVKENITSPTFVIMKMYNIGDSNKVSPFSKKVKDFKKLVHIDAYRLEKGADLEALNFKEIVADSNNLVLIEWADNVKEGLPQGIKVIEFEYVDQLVRSIVL